MKKKIYVITLFAILALSVTWVLADNHSHAEHQKNTESIENAQTLCPIMGKAINKDVFVDHKGKRIYFCCAGCIDKFNENPDKYLKSMAKQGITLEATPACTGCQDKNCTCHNATKSNCGSCGCGSKTTKI